MINFADITSTVSLKRGLFKIIEYYDKFLIVEVPWGESVIRTPITFLTLVENNLSYLWQSFYGRPNKLPQRLIECFERQSLLPLISKMHIKCDDSERRFHSIKS